MIFNEIKCRVNTSLGLVGGMYPLHHPPVSAPGLACFFISPINASALRTTMPIELCITPHGM